MDLAVETLLTVPHRGLFRSKTFVLLFLAGAIGTFAVLVPPYCMPLFAESIGLSSTTGAAMAAAFNAASAVGRIGSGVLSDKVGALNVLFASTALLGTSMFVVWPFASTLGVTVVFVLLCGIAVGGFLSMIPTSVGHLFGSARMSVTMGMILTGWTGGYTMVSFNNQPSQKKIHADCMTQGAPVVGYILEASGGSGNGLAPFRPAMFFAGSLAFASTILIGVLRFRREREILAKS